jgi:hypothetical protein
VALKQTPGWSSLSFEELIEKAFAGRLIDVQHPLFQELKILGE